MAKSLPPDTDNRPEPRRRPSDTGGTMAGIAEGGRTKSDRISDVAPKNRWVTLAITCSFLFSGILFFWAFSRPYQSVFHGHDQQLGDGSANRVGLGYEASSTEEEYEQYIDDLDRNLLKQVRLKHTTPRVPSKEHTKRHLERRLDVMKSDFERLGEKQPEKGTAEWQEMKALEDVATDLELGP